MTDGIIQQVYRKLASPLIVEIDDVDVPVIPQQMVDDAFKELIEKIKQEIQSDDDITIRLIVKKLIGDNQE